MKTINKQTKSLRKRKPMASKTKTDIENAASEAVKVIANAASEAARVVANAASEAVKVSNEKGANDHDLLIRIQEQVISIKGDIKEIKDGTAKDIADSKKEIGLHDERIRALETRVSKYFITITLYSLLILGLAGLVINHILASSPK